MKLLIRTEKTCKFILYTAKWHVSKGKVPKYKPFRKIS
jgi:hypothetical protein